MRTRKLAPVGCALAILMCAVPAARAQNITVTSTADADDASANGVCDSPCTLRGAIDTAESFASPGPDVISVPAGTYPLSLGRLYITTPITLTGAGARDTIFQSNGSAQAMAVSAAGADVTLSGFTLTGGVETGGGAGLAVGDGNVTVSQLAIVGNHATNFQGGGVEVDGGTVTIQDSLVAGNQAVSGGAGIFVGGSGTASLTNVTISGNSTTGGASSGPGGITAFGNVTFTNDTISDNTAGKGAGAQFQSSSTISAKNTIIAGNHSTSTPGDCFFNGSPVTTSAGHNISGTDTCNFHATGDQSATDPLLGALGNNGGPTDTMAIPQNSPAVDAGDSSGCPAADQRGVTRPQLGGCDIGAFEFKPLPVPVPAPGPGPIVDTTPPLVKLLGLKKQHVRQRFVLVIVKLNEAGTVKVSGTVSTPGSSKTYKLKSVKRTIPGNVRAVFKPRYSRKKYLIFRKAIVKNHIHSVKAKLTIAATDGSGNTKTVHRTVRLIYP